MDINAIGTYTSPPTHQPLLSHWLLSILPMYGHDLRLSIAILLNTPVTPYASMSDYAQALVRRLQAAFAHASEELHQSHLTGCSAHGPAALQEHALVQVRLFIPVIPRGQTTELAR